jgi:hypothetical protein
MEEWLKPSDSGSRVGDLRECTGRNASERRASLEKDDAQADPTATVGSSMLALILGLHQKARKLIRGNLRCRGGSRDAARIC